MTSFGYRFNPRYAIEECSSCGTLYTRNCDCSIRAVEDKILVPKPPKNCAWCTRCGYWVDGPHCQGCALLRQELEENLVTYSPDFQNTSEPSNASTNVLNAPREPYVVKQDNGSFIDEIIFDLNRAPDSPNQFHCFHCKDVLRDGETCKRCTCKFCGKDAHTGYNCPSKVPVISIPEPCNNRTIDELPQALPNFHPTFHSEAESPFTLDSTPTYVDESPNVFNLLPQPSVYPCEFCGNNAYFGHYCTPQAPFIYLEPCYNQDFNFSQNFQNVPQQYPCCDDCEVTHEPYQCQPKNHDYYDEQNSCYDSNSFGFDQIQTPQYTINHPIFNAHNDLLNTQNKLMEQMTSICEMVDQLIQKKLEEKLTPNEPVNSLSMGDEHLDTIPVTESDEFIKSSIENLVPNPKFVSENSNADIESFSPSPIMEEIDLTFTPDDPMPLSIKEDDNDSRDILIREELLDNYSLLIPENESFHFDIPSFSRPPAKPPYGNTGILNIKMMGDVSDRKVPTHELTITLVSNQEKSPDLLSHRGFENLQPSAECPMKIHGKNIPTLDVPRF
nr:hypothetical protein [Tanacetum cinerariifolium]